MAKKKAVTRAPDEHRFWACNGDVLSDLHDVAACLNSMSKDEFMHHVNAEKNDFANWVHDILGDKTLATSLRKVKTKAGTLKKIQAKL